LRWVISSQLLGRKPRHYSSAC